jgi:translation initiation factor IF-3
VIGQEGEQLGIMPTETALALAMEAGMDLVEVAPNSRPPVCRVMDYGKFKYDKKKRSKKKPHVTKVKEVRFRPKTDEHDYEFKVKRALGFLGEGHRVVVTVLFRGREMAFRDRGKKILERLTKDLEHAARPEQAPRLEGRRFTMVFLPNKAGGKGPRPSERLPKKDSGRRPKRPTTGTGAPAKPKEAAPEPAEGTPPTGAPVKEAPPGEAPPSEATPAKAPADETAPAKAPADETPPAKAPAEETPPAKAPAGETPPAAAPATAEIKEENPSEGSGGDS